MPGRVIAYIVPYFPLLSCAILLLSFRRRMAEEIASEYDEGPATRLLIFSLAGFSYAGLLALAIISTMAGINLDLSAYYLLVSFLSYYLALNLHNYKYRLWHDHLCNALIDAGALSLILSVLSVIFSSHFSQSYKTWMAVSAFMVWYLDHVVRIWIAARHLGSWSYNTEAGTTTESKGTRASRRRKKSGLGDTLWYVAKGYKSE